MPVSFISEPKIPHSCGNTVNKNCFPTILSKTGVSKDSLEDLQGDLFLSFWDFAQTLRHRLSRKCPKCIREALDTLSAFATPFSAQLLQPMLTEPTQRVAKKSTSRVNRFPQQIALNQTSPRIH